MSAALARLATPTGPGGSRPVIGYVGADVPVELLTAAGAHPVRLTGSPGEPSTAGDRYLGTGLDPVARSVLTRLLDGAYGCLDGLVVGRDCEASSRLFYAVRELKRIDPAAPLPPVQLVDVLHLPHRTTTRYVHAKLTELRATLETWAGRPITGDDLAEAIEEHNRLRGLLRRIGALRGRRPAPLTGTDALSVVAATTRLLVRDACALVEQLLAGKLSEVDGLRVFLTGSGHDEPGVYAALEEAGLVIVGEDHDWGDLLSRRDVEAPTMLALAERYQHNGPSAPRASIRQRAEHTAEAARTRGAEALISYARVHDDAPPWDFPAQRALCGLPSVQLVRQPYGGLTEEALAAVAGLRGPVGAVR
ncbi:2-hydroxyacyl-CoA dehydratase [Prauserella sp. PE36]|uniref:2-hydroxyacyl-CoA dehydratase subunit D n=1 Tax=Prauserella sp. PE36 TaxID=1504709 RepID=UPI000DE22CC8|nr:2-hydroxyacyl-CoA dehydratase family protein [Prauserella sp. PE36]RBM21018.1 2-hydroxyacyl-CoA dehydratase [Prauserella sp. PE36]